MISKGWKQKALYSGSGDKSFTRAGQETGSGQVASVGLIIEVLVSSNDPEIELQH